MSDSLQDASPQAAAEPPATGTARWPRVIGILGLIVGALMFIDQLDDLLLLPLLRSESWWRGLVGDELAALISRWMPPAPWLIFVSLVGMTLGAVLFVGGLRLNSGRRSGAALCRTWAWLALAWLAVEMGAAAWWLSRYAGELSELAPGVWQAPAILGLGLAMVILAAFPVFLLSWFSRPAIKAQLAGWPQ